MEMGRRRCEMSELTMPLPNPLAKHHTMLWPRRLLLCLLQHFALVSRSSPGYTLELAVAVTWVCSRLRVRQLSRLYGWPGSSVRVRRSVTPLQYQYAPATLN